MTLLPWTIYWLITGAVLVSLLGIMIVNLLVLPSIKEYAQQNIEVPAVAVLVPARNEEANIEGCLRSLLAQDYANFQVWLYDDASSDSTGAIARLIAHEDKSRGKLYVVSGSGEPPAGWLGKANACHEMYLAMLEHSSPDYLLFTDADVRFGPKCLGQAIATAQKLNSGLLSIFPRQITGSWAERLAVPTLLHWTVYQFLPLPLAMWARSGPAFAAANGQFMLFTHQAYKALGGHTAIRDEILEDVALARATKQAGYSTILADGRGHVWTRMYNGSHEVWEGYSKNAFAFFGYSPPLLFAGIAVLLLLYVLPVILLLYGAVTEQTGIILPAAGAYVLGVIPRLLIAFRFRYRPADALLHPLSVMLMVLIDLNSLRWWITGKSTWKGRKYEGLGKHG
ncbi:MAG: glycosyltransferase [Chloroflexota bacterium]|nr:glycosyltransferase [Chloroflexota bacterium]